MPGTAQATDWLIVGAGIAGLTLARELTHLGQSVRLIDKGFYPGGRLASRRVAGESQVDHGVARFALPEAHDWLQRPDIRVVKQPDGNALAVPAHGARALARSLAHGLDVMSGTRVARIEQVESQAESRWHAATDDGRVWTAKTLVLAIPAAQAAALIQTVASEPAAAIAQVAMAPVWVLTGTIPRETRVMVPRLQPMIDTLDRTGLDQDPARQAVRVAASLPWSQRHVDADPDHVRTALLVHLSRAGCVDVQSVDVHRWRFALPPDSQHGVAPSLPPGLHVIGDWTQPGGMHDGVMRAIASAQALSREHRSSAPGVAP